MSDDVIDPTSGPGPSTLAVHAGAWPATPGGPLVSPVLSSATFHSADPEAGGEVLYGRYANAQNYRLIGEKIAALEGAEAGLAVGSGMAAISLAVLTFCGAGDHVVTGESLYGGTLTLMRRELPRLGIEVTPVDPAGRWRDALRQNTRLLYMEAPVNPTLRVPDPRPVAQLARERGIPLVLDATFATPINFRPLEHGVDVVVHSGTKYLGGHSDLVAGALAGPAAFIERARERLKSFGPALDPHALWLLERGMKTLALRVRRQNETALALARWLGSHPAVRSVLYPGLESHPDHAVAGALFSGFGGMLSLIVEGGDEAAHRVMRSLRLIAMAPSLGGVESLASMPGLTSHASLSREQRHALGIEDGFIRLSIGIEDEPDLRADLDAALRAARGAGRE